MFFTDIIHYLHFEFSRFSKRKLGAFKIFVLSILYNNQAKISRYIIYQQPQSKKLILFS